MNPDEALEIIDKLSIDDNTKNELKMEVQNNGVTDGVIGEIKRLAEETESDIKNLNEIVDITKNAKEDIDSIKSDAANEIDNIASDSEKQLKELENEADKADDMFEQITTDMEEKKKEDLRKKIEE
jgi:ABC-type transporter Mla subunit MlaD